MEVVTPQRTPPKRSSAKFIVPFLIGAIALGFFGGIEYQKSREFTPQIDGVVNLETEKPEGVDFGLFWEAWTKLSQKHVDRADFDPETMVFGAIKGLVDSVGDPYTVFLEPQEAKQFEENVKGAFGGVGVEIGIRDEILTVIAPLKDSPGDRAGLLAGDKITKVDGKDTAGLTLEEAVSEIRGPKGEEVVLTVYRDSFERPRDFGIIRDTIRIPAVTWEMRDDTIGYIRLHTFNGNINNEFRDAVRELLDRGMESVILDMRNNPGGLLDMAVRISSWFVDEDLPIVIENFGDDNKNVFTSFDIGILKETPAVILINGGSASASEIVAGALRDHRGIQLIGEKTFGKGSVQQIEDLKEGSLKVTVAKWLTPNGHSISDNGIEPDIIVEITEEDREAGDDPQLDKAIELLKN